MNELKPVPGKAYGGSNGAGANPEMIEEEKEGSAAAALLAQKSVVIMADAAVQQTQEKIEEMK